VSYQITRTSYQQHHEGIRSIRQRVFVDEQKIDPKLEWDDLDHDAEFFIALNEHADIIATARFFTDGKIGRMAVLADYRNLGIGSAMLKEIEQFAEWQSIKTLHLSAQTSAIEFYQKNGYLIEGEVYLEAGIPHQNMYKENNAGNPA